MTAGKHARVNDLDLYYETYAQFGTEIDIDEASDRWKSITERSS